MNTTEPRWSFRGWLLDHAELAAAWNISEETLHYIEDNERREALVGNPRPTVIIPDSTSDADFGEFIVAMRKVYGSFDIESSAGPRIEVQFRGGHEVAEAAIRTMEDAEAYAEALRMSPEDEARFEAWIQSRCVGHRTCLFQAWKAATEAARADSSAEITRLRERLGGVA